MSYDTHCNDNAVVIIVSPSFLMLLIFSLIYKILGESSVSVEFGAVERLSL